MRESVAFWLVRQVSAIFIWGILLQGIQSISCWDTLVVKCFYNVIPQHISRNYSRVNLRIHYRGMFQPNYFFLARSDATQSGKRFNKILAVRIVTAAVSLHLVLLLLMIILVVFERISVKTPPESAISWGHVRLASVILSLTI